MTDITDEIEALLNVKAWLDSEEEEKHEPKA